MAEEPLRTTLAYTKSPKTSKRTTFQDELEAAISARAKHSAAQRNTISYSDDFEDDDDDILNELLKTRRKKMDIFKTGRSKIKTNNFQLSDEEEENVRPKKVSFLKSERRSLPVQDDQPDSARRSDTAGSSDSQRSLPEGDDHHARSTPQSDPPADWKIPSESAPGRKSQSEPLMSRKSLSESPLPLNSENSRWDSPVPAEGALYDSPLALSSERGDEDLLRALIGEDREHPPPQPRERSSRQRPPTGLVEDKPPMPRPRQRGAPVGSSGHDEGDGRTETPSSRAATSSVSIPLSFSDRHTTMSASSDRLGSSGSDGMQIAEEPYTASVKTDILSSSPTQRTTEALLSPLEGAGSGDLCLDQNAGDKYATSSEENLQQGSGDPTGLTVSRQSNRTERSQDRPPSSRPASSRKSRSACSSYTAESKYLGSLKVLDQKKSLQESQPDTSDSLRAAVYQDWLKKKEEKLQDALKIKKQEEKLKEEKKMEEEVSKKAVAKASYEAWKEKKQETLREKLREKQEVLKKQQKEKEEKEEKKETAKRVFEKWKQEHDDRLQEQHLKQTLQKNRLKDRKEREQGERRRDCSSSFSMWSEKKKDAIQEKLKEEREKEKIKEIEEKYQKEEKEKTALEMYEKWLKRKEFLQKREKQEKKIKAIVQDEPPPPWSPPNRTIPFVHHLTSNIPQLLNHEATGRRSDTGQKDLDRINILQDQRPLTLTHSTTMTSVSHTLACVLILCAFTTAQRGDSSVSPESCVPNDGFGRYCPTTCGIADYLHRYKPGLVRDLDDMEQILLDIANLTKGAQDKVVFLKDSETQAQKAAPDTFYQKSRNMLDDVLRFEKSIVTQEEQIYNLQTTLAANDKRMLELKKLALELDQKCKMPCKDTVEIQTVTGKDCQDVANKGGKVSGLYYVQPTRAPTPFLVYCEIDTFGRGWTVLQRRRDGTVSFNRKWNAYKEGFGYLSPDDTTEFWLGNEKIHLLSVQSSVPYVLRLEMVDWTGAKKYADYAMFKVGPEVDKYRLTYAYYFGGDAGDAFDGFDFGGDPSDKFYTSHNGMQFSTPDQDNDKYNGNCAKQEGSGWWMNRCHAAHLNGKYYNGGQYTAKDSGQYGFDNGIIWATWHSRWYSLKQTTMKIIPINRIQAGGQQGSVDFGKGDFPSP